MRRFGGSAHSHTVGSGCSIVAVLILMGACGGGVAEPVTPGEIATYTVASEPEVSIGTDTILGPLRLRQVSDATLQSDGSVVVAVCEAAEIRWFDSDGRHIRSAGGRGDEPGQFQFPQRMFRLGGDTLAVGDLLRGVTVLNPTGGVESAPGDPRSWFRVRPFDRLANGLFVARAYDRDASVPPGTPYRATASLMLVSSDGEIVDSLGGLPSHDVRSPTSERGPRLGLRLSRRAVFAVQGDRIYYGAQDGRGIIEYDADLVPRRTINTITRPAPVTPVDMAEYQRMRDERAHFGPGGVAGATVELYAPMMPAFRDLVAGRDGQLWVEDPERPWLHPLTWTAYDEGEPVARVEIPPRFYPFEFGEDWVLGVNYRAYEDADERVGTSQVETVELRRFVPGPLPGVTLPPRDAQPPAVPRCSGWTSR